MSELDRPDGARIHYDVHGAGAPVLVLRGSDSRYDPVAELAATRTVVVADRRHDGASRAPAEPFSWEQAAADQIALLDHLGIDRVDVVASGIGCAHAWRLVHDAPHRVRSVVCEAPVGRDGGSFGAFFAPFDEAMRVARADGMDGVVAAARRDGRFDRNPGAGPFAARLHRDEEFCTEVAALRRECYITLLVRFRDAQWDAGSCWFSVGEDWMARFPVPMLVVAADDGSTVAKRLARDVPAVRLLDRPADPARIAAFLSDPRAKES